MRRGLSLPGHPSDTPAKGSGSATSKGARAKSVTSAVEPSRSSDVIHTEAGTLTPQGHREDTEQPSGAQQSLSTQASSQSHLQSRRPLAPQ